MTQPFTPTNGLAVAAAWLGAVAVVVALGTMFALYSPLGIFIAWLASIVPGMLAIIFGIIGVTSASKIGGRRRAPAIWGIVLGVGALPVAILVRFGIAALIGI